MLCGDLETGKLTRKELQVPQAMRYSNVCDKGSIIPHA